MNLNQFEEEEKNIVMGTTGNNTIQISFAGILYKYQYFIQKKETPNTIQLCKLIKKYSNVKWTYVTLQQFQIYTKVKLSSYEIEQDSLLKINISNVSWKCIQTDVASDKIRTKSKIEEKKSK